MKNEVSVILSAAILIAASSVFARTIDPIVSVDWLAAHADDVVIVDVRPEAVYNQSHIPGAINEPWIVPMSAWIVVGPEGQLLEMPADDALEDEGLGQESAVPGGDTVDQPARRDLVESRPMRESAQIHSVHLGHVVPCCIQCTRRPARGKCSVTRVLVGAP